jgi:hypothetical protein
MCKNQDLFIHFSLDIVGCNSHLLNDGCNYMYFSCFARHGGGGLLLTSPLRGTTTPVNNAVPWLDERLGPGGGGTDCLMKIRQHLLEGVKKQ